MTTLTIQPSGSDTRLYEGLPDTEYGTIAYMTIGDIGVGKLMRSILKFDFSALPADVVITSATLSIYYYTTEAGTPEGRTYDAKRITQTAWVEAEANWNDYNTGNAWAAGGGDFTETLKASTVVPAVSNWIDFDVIGQVDYANRLVSKVAHFIVMDSVDDDGENRSRFYTNNEVTQTTLRPKLVIEYYLTSTLGTTRPDKLYGGVKEKHPKDGWDNEKYFMVEQSNPMPCVVQYWDLFVQTNNE